MKKSVFVAAALLFAVFNAGAFAYAAEPPATVEALIASYKKAAGVETFSAEEGKKLFMSKRVHSEKKDERSCTTCHTVDPKQKGKTQVGKVIEPMARSVNPKRFTDPKKMEKWFARNCSWVLERKCTPKEKGDFIAFMTSI